MGFSNLQTIFRLKGLTAISSNGHEYWKKPKSWLLHQPFSTFISARHWEFPLAVNDDIKIQLFKNARTLREFFLEEEIKDARKKQTLAKISKSRNWVSICNKPGRGKSKPKAKRMMKTNSNYIVQLYSRGICRNKILSVGYKAMRIVP